MKKISLLAIFATMFALNVSATDLFTGSHAVTWDTPLNLEAAKFSEAKAGDKIVVSNTDAADGIEFKVLDVWSHLAGSREAAWIGGNGTYEQFLTPNAVDSIKAHGLQIVGNHFTCTKVELLDGKELKEGISVWSGFFWADDWKTLELYAEGYNYVDFSNISALRIYSEAGRTNYVIKVLSSWDEGGLIAEKTNMTDGDGYAELALTDELRTKLSTAGHWMIQFDKQDGEAFNVTDVVLIPIQTAIINTKADSKAVKLIENGQIVILKDGVRYNVLGAKF